MRLLLSMIEPGTNGDIKEKTMSGVMIAKTAKTLVTALVLTSASLAVAAGAFAAPTKAPTYSERLWMDRASNPDTNGF